MGIGLGVCDVRRFWSLGLLILASCIVIVGLEYSLRGGYQHQHARALTVKLNYHTNTRTATISGRTKQGVIVTLQSGNRRRRVISNKQNGRFSVQMPVQKTQSVVVRVVGQKAQVLMVTTGSKSSG